MVTEQEVRALIAKLRGVPTSAYIAKVEGVAKTPFPLGLLCKEAAEALEQMLPSFYLDVDGEPGEGVNALEHVVTESGQVRHVIPQTAWDDCWVARRGEAVACFPSREEADAWVQEGSHAV